MMHGLKNIKKNIVVCLFRIVLRSKQYAFVLNIWIALWVWGVGGNLREGNHLEDLGVDGKKILKWMFKKWDGRAWTGLIWLRIGTGGGPL